MTYAHPAFGRICAVLDAYVFQPRNEADMQTQVAKVLAADSMLAISREVVADHGRYDVQVLYGSPQPTALVVLELKLRASIALVERQAQRYAMTHGVDAVMVLTTSRKLEREFRGTAELGGKPFHCRALRRY